MAKKVTIESLKDELTQLEAQEQTPEIMAKIDDLKGQIEKMEAEAKALAEEIARNEAEKAAKEKEKAEKKAADEAAKKKGRFSTYEVWRMEWKGVGNDRKLVRDKVKKTVKILDEHASILNEQRENTLLEYVKKGG